MILGALLVGHIGFQAYRWFAFGPERVRLERLTGELEAVGVEVVRSQLAADSLRLAVEAIDRDLEATRSGIAEYRDHATDGALPANLYLRYRRDLHAHNLRVSERNEWFEGWRAAISRNRHAVRRYNMLADSIRSTAAVMGEPYYSIPTPAEIALERGIVPRP